MPLNPRLQPRIPARPWQPLTDAEWDAIRPYLPDPRLGGATATRRKTLDAIFWVAASRGPWRELPTHLGKPDSVSRTLRRWARARVIERLLMAVSDHPLAGGSQTLRRLAWFICRAFRRMARILPEDSVILARTLRMTPALPACFVYIPDPRLSEMVRSVMIQQVAALRTASRAATAEILDALKAGHRVLATCFGNRRKWRLR